MKSLIVYDSVFGNTEKIAQEIRNALGSQEGVEMVRVSDIKPDHLRGLGLLIVGSPTRGFRATPAITNFLKQIPSKGLEGVKVAAFDTRISVTDINSRMLNIFVKVFGYAAEPIAKKLVKKGGVLAVHPEGFIVQDSEGPLKDGETKRAADWAKLAAKV